MFNLINKKKLLRKLNGMYNMMLPMEKLMRDKWKKGEFSKWEFYTRLWKLKGRLSEISDLKKMLG